jgi:hypothetical protein
MFMIAVAHSHRPLCYPSVFKTSWSNRLVSLLCGLYWYRIAPLKLWVLISMISEGIVLMGMGQRLIGRAKILKVGCFIT